MFSNVDTYSADKQLELSERLKLMEHTPQVIALQEVKPKNYRYEKSIAEYKLDGYDIVEHNLNANEGRGLLLYVKENTKCTSVELSTNYSEYCSIELKNGSGETVMVTSVYRSPNSTAENNAYLLELLQEISETKYVYKLMLGDFNLPHINWENYTTEEGPQGFSTVFIEKIRDCYFTQHVKEITRMRGDNKGNTLDLLFSNDDSIVEEVKLNSPLGRSDHACVLVTCDIQDMAAKGRDMYYMYEKANYHCMRRSLDIDWDIYLSADLTTEQKWRKFINKMMEIIDEWVPKRKFIGKQSMRKRTNVNLPMSGHLWTKIKKKQRLWRRLTELRRNIGAGHNREWAETEVQYRRLNNQIRWETRNATKLKEKEIARNVKENPKIFWKYVSSKTRTKSRIADLYTDEDRLLKTTCDKEKAMVLSDKFSAVFVTEPEGELPRPQPREAPILENIEITHGMIRKAIQKLKRNKSPGPDGVHPRIIKEMAGELLIPLKILFDSSMEEGVVPEDWRIAHVTPIYKKGNKSDPGNYRPVSLTSIFCKLMESILREAIMAHMKRNKLFSSKQFGFISGRSTVLQLIQVLDNWTEALDEGQAIDVIYCDFMKAFDKVPHKRLMAKVRSYGIDGHMLRWIEGFLTGRRQRVVISGETSEWREVTSGVPQGSVLGPLLFVMYINDLPEAIRHDSEVYLYADDTKLFRRIAGDEDCGKLQEDLDELRSWSERWMLNFHPEKSKHMRLGKANIREHEYTMFNTIASTNAEKDIGVVVDNKLTFSAHLAEKINKANKIVGIIRRTFIYLDPTIFKALYTALIRPHLEYANQIWCPHLVKDVEAVENVQRRATKLVPQLKDLPYEERLKKLELPTLAYRRSRGDQIEAYKIITQKYDQDCTQGIFQMREGDATRGNTKKLFKTRARLNIRKYAFPNRVVNNWNDLPEWVVNAETVVKFESSLDRVWKGQEQKYNYRAHITTTTTHNQRHTDNQAIELESQA